MKGKIKEIREALEKATPGPWKIADTTDGYVLLDADDRELAFCDSIGRVDDARCENCAYGIADKVFNSNIQCTNKDHIRYDRNSDAEYVIERWAYRCRYYRRQNTIGVTVE